MSDVRLPKQPIIPITGAYLKVVAYKEDAAGVLGERATMVGRGSGFSWDASFPVQGVPELGSASPGESVYGASGGINFSISKYMGLNLAAENHMPNLDEAQEVHLNRPNYTLQLIVSHGPYRGRIYATLTKCKFSQTSGNMQTTGLVQGSYRGLALNMNYNEFFLNLTEGLAEDTLPDIPSEVPVVSSLY